MDVAANRIDQVEFRTVRGQGYSMAEGRGRPAAGWKPDYLCSVEYLASTDFAHLQAKILGGGDKRERFRSVDRKGAYTIQNRSNFPQHCVVRCRCLGEL